MFDGAEKYEAIFSDMLELDDRSQFFNFLIGHGRKGLGPPSSDDWEHVRHFIHFLSFIR